MVLSGVQSLEDLYETFRVSKLISLWKSMDPVVSSLAEDVLLKTAEYCSSSVGSVILKSNVTRILHNKASCSSYDNIIT